MDRLVQLLTRILRKLLTRALSEDPLERLSQAIGLTFTGSRTYC